MTSLRKGNTLLLFCGHHYLLPEPIEVDCDACEAGHTMDDQHLYLAGYRAGLCSTHGVEYETMQRLAHAWLDMARKELGHSEGCQCQGCKAAAKVLAIDCSNTAGLEAHGKGKVGQ